MLKKLVVLLALFVFSVSLAGCASIAKRERQTQGLKNQVVFLEARIQSQNDEISNLREALGKAIEEKEALLRKAAKKRVIAEVKSRPNAKQIQIALKNAGYNPGRIDGKMGGQTREAIKNFQSDNNLKVDGKVGKQTWRLLRKYLYQKVK